MTFQNATYAGPAQSPRDQYYCRNCGSRCWRINTKGIMEIDSGLNKIVAKGEMNSGIICADCGQPPVQWLFRELEDWFFGVRAESQKSAEQKQKEEEMSESEHKKGIVLLCPVDGDTLNTVHGQNVCAVMYSSREGVEPTDREWLQPWGLGSAEIPTIVIQEIFEKTDATEVFVVPLSFGHRTLVAARRTILTVDEEGDGGDAGTGTEESTDGTEEGESTTPTAETPRIGNQGAKNGNGETASIPYGVQIGNYASGSPFEPTDRIYDGKQITTFDSVLADRKAFVDACVAEAAEAAEGVEEPYLCSGCRPIPELGPRSEHHCTHAGCTCEQCIPNDGDGGIGPGDGERERFTYTPSGQRDTKQKVRKRRM